MANINVLSQRYASPEMNHIFSPVNRIIQERCLWLMIMEIQGELGVTVNDRDIQRFRSAVEKVNLDRIQEIETVTRHDVKARLEAFIEEAGGSGPVHLGLTSRDITDNVEQMLIRQAGKLILGRFTAVLQGMLHLAGRYQNLVITGRTHHQPAQPTTLGRRFAQWGEELHFHLLEFENFLNNYPLRGIKGPLGTCHDQSSILGGKDKVRLMERQLSSRLGFKNIMEAVGQVYFRSLDYKLAGHIQTLTAPCVSMAQSIRLMAGLGLAGEGFGENQTGSSAMPHKKNCRTSERVWGMGNLIKMFTTGLGSVSGGQWEEGDVSCSVIRRVIIPDLFYTADGLCRGVLTILNEFQPHISAIEEELQHHLPFLATTEILTMAVKAGINREEAHSIIRKAATSLNPSDDSPGKTSALASLLSRNPVFTEKEITGEMIDGVISESRHNIGLALEQVQGVIDMTEPFLLRHQHSARYHPGSIL